MFVKVIDHNMRVRFFETQCRYATDASPSPHIPDLQNNSEQIIAKWNKSDGDIQWIQLGRRDTGDVRGLEPTWHTQSSRVDCHLDTHRRCCLCRGHPTAPVTDGQTAMLYCHARWSPSLPHAEITVCSQCGSAAYLPSPMLQSHQWCANMPTLAAGSGASGIQDRRANP